MRKSFIAGALLLASLTSAQGNASRKAPYAADAGYVVVNGLQRTRN